MNKLESKISKRIESREFVKEFDNIQISGSNVELNNSVIGRLGSGIIKEKLNKPNNIVGDFLVGGNYYDDNRDERILVLNVKFNKFKDVVQPLLEFFNSIEANEFEDVEEFAYETAARLEAEEQERQEAEEQEEQEGETDNNDNKLPVIS